MKKNKTNNNNKNKNNNNNTSRNFLPFKQVYCCWWLVIN